MFIPPWWLRDGWAMTIFTALASGWLTPRLAYREHVFTGDGGVPLFGLWAKPTQAKGTLVATYGMIGDLRQPGFLHWLAYRAVQRGYAVLLFDSRGQGKTGWLSPALPSDGLQEGYDFLALATAAQGLGCPPPYWFVGYSLGGQLALWAGWAAMQASRPLPRESIGGIVAVCPNLDAHRSLQHLRQQPLGRLVEQLLTQELKRKALRLHQAHPQAISRQAIDRITSIWTFDQELVVPRLGFQTVADYYAASSPLQFLDQLTIPTLVLYSRDDPLFAPEILPELEQAAAANPALDLVLTDDGGHVGYYSSWLGQWLANDPDPWWAWHRVLDWCDGQLLARP
ncbi:MAG: alpha/beta fold hydrolase [Gloeomargarita sp. SKYBB_i_bin120]|nr:alpha/beta fold hydrolase [Gloeomargarita sp. SKYB120]MDW8177766.1 alpha/beta fold hydrolase [Gloeomargarita sp. SKYBB_i_bin120]